MPSRRREELTICKRYEPEFKSDCRTARGAAEECRGFNFAAVTFFRSWLGESGRRDGAGSCRAQLATGRLGVSMFSEPAARYDNSTKPFL